MADVAATRENGVKSPTVASLNSFLQIYFAQDDVLDERVGGFLHF